MGAGVRAAAQKLNIPMNSEPTPSRDSESAVDLDREYSPSSCVDDIGVFLDEYAGRSAEATSADECYRLRCGPEPDQILDYFPAARVGKPLQVYIHGGYLPTILRADWRINGLNQIADHLPCTTYCERIARCRVGRQSPVHARAGGQREGLEHFPFVDDYRTANVLGAFFGLRLSEIAAARIEDMNWTTLTS